jgi:glyoxylase-like metal-dependent hydrolase (beta-lactamase superfamily II)
VDTPYNVGKVNLYTFDVEGGFIMFDSGPPTAEMKNYLLHKLDLKKLKKLFITHCHADHCGMLNFIRENSDADIYLSKYDIMLNEKLDERVDTIRTVLTNSGFPSELCERMLSMLTPGYRTGNFRVLEESGEDLKELGLTYLPCTSHSQSDIVYLYKGYAISGDVILKNIFTTPLLDMDFNRPKERFHNYAAYCDTVRKLKSIENYNFLPGHRDTIGSVEERIIYYVSKMFQRAIRLRLVINSSSIYDVVRSVISDIQASPPVTFIKASEIFFFKDMLSNPAPLREALEETGLSDIFRRQFKAVLS